MNRRFERLEAVHRVARADADDALVRLDPDDRDREDGPRQRVPRRRERRIERDPESIQADRGDTHREAVSPTRPDTVRFGLHPDGHGRRVASAMVGQAQRRRSSSSTTSPSTTTPRPRAKAAGHARRRQRPLDDRPGGQDLLPRRAVGLRQDHLAQDGQPAHRADVRPDQDRRRRRRDPRADRPAPEHRLRHPAGRALPAPDDRRQRRDRAAAAGLAGRRQKERSEELLGLVGLDPAKYRDRFPSQLSGGERQRVGVARALAADPPIMLMDEPFGAVDPIVRDRLQNEFLRLQETIAKTILFVTHDIDEAIKMGDLVAVFQTGGILAQFGPPLEILAGPRLGVRRPVRRPGPRAQAAVPAPRRRRRAAAGRHRQGRRPDRRGPRAGRRGPGPLRARRRRGAPSARLGRSTTTSQRGHGQRGDGQPGLARRSTGGRPSRTRCR